MGAGCTAAPQLGQSQSLMKVISYSSSALAQEESDGLQTAAAVLLLRQSQKANDFVLATSCRCRAVLSAHVHEANKPVCQWKHNISIWGGAA